MSNLITLKMDKKISVKNPNEIIFWLKQNGVPFEIEQTMFTIKVKSKFGLMSFVNKTSDIKPHELAFIGSVKKHCEKNPKSIDVDRKTINYIFDGRLKQSYHYRKDIYEIDLTGAYWNFAKANNYIDDNLYLRGLEVRKVIRLIALGNLAKRTLELKFDGNKFSKPFFRPSYLTQNVFFHVSFLTDLLMRKLIILANNDFLFYWVDAIFVSGEKARDKIIDYLDSEEIKCKCLQIQDVLKQEHKIITLDESHINLEKNETGQLINEFGMRVFNFRKTNFINLINKTNE